MVSAGNRNLSPRYISKDVGQVSGTALNLPAGTTSTAALMTDKPFQLKCFATQKVKDQQYTLSDSVIFDTSAELPVDTVVMGDYHVILEKRDGYYKLSARSDNKELDELPLELSGDEASIQAITLSNMKFDNLSASYISSHQPSALTIRPAAAGQVRLSFSQVPTKPLSVTVYSVSGARLCHQTLSPNGSTTYTLSVPQANSGAYIVQVTSPESALTGSDIIRW